MTWDPSCNPLRNKYLPEPLGLLTLWDECGPLSTGFFGRKKGSGMCHGVSGSEVMSSIEIGSGGKVAEHSIAMFCHKNSTALIS